MAVKDLGIFFLESSAPVFRYHFYQLAGASSENWSYYTTPQDFINSQHQRRVACFQIPYPYQENNPVEQAIDAVYDHCDAIIVIGSELHPRTVDFVRRYDRSKIAFFVCGNLQPALAQAQTYKFLDWFTTTINFYKNTRPVTLFDLKPYEVKPYAFDALLGRKKPHRDQAYEFIKQHQLPGITTYINDHDLSFDNRSQDQWIWELPGLEDYSNVRWTVDRVMYHGRPISLSQIIPITVYNQSAYSLVCETNFENDYVFYTEKTVKPILARRLFVLLSHRYALARLRDLGFRTFDSILDESYDEVEAPILRHQLALEQLAWLCQQDQVDILSRCREIVDHNYDLMMGHDWYADFTRPLARILLNQ
jgi:hypothetical protein